MCWVFEAVFTSFCWKWTFYPPFFFRSFDRTNSLLANPGAIFSMHKWDSETWLESSQVKSSSSVERGEKERLSFWGVICTNYGFISHTTISESLEDVWYTWRLPFIMKMCISPARNLQVVLLALKPQRRLLAAWIPSREAAALLTDPLLAQQRGETNLRTVGAGGAVTFSDTGVLFMA